MLVVHVFPPLRPVQPLPLSCCQTPVTFVSVSIYVSVSVCFWLCYCSHHCCCCSFSSSLSCCCCCCVCTLHFPFSICSLGHLFGRQRVRVVGICRLLHFRLQASCCRRCRCCCCCCLPLLKLHTSAFLPAAAFCLLAVFGFLNGFCQIVTGPGQFSKFPAQLSRLATSLSQSLSLIQRQQQRHFHSPFKPLSHFRPPIQHVVRVCVCVCFVI